MVQNVTMMNILGTFLYMVQNAKLKGILSKFLYMVQIQI